jgi:hypothetical protein
MKILPKTKWQKRRFYLLITLAFIIISIRFVVPLITMSMYEPKEGDIIFQPLPRFSDLIRTIEGVTHSQYSHCGVVIKVNGKWKVIEALGHVKITPLYKWIGQGRYGQFDVYRLKPQYIDIIPTFIKKLKTYLGAPYDVKYKMDDDAIYCSELVYKGFYDATTEKLGKLVMLGDLDWKLYRETIEKYENGPVPLDRAMITPKHLAEAKQIVKVFGFSL